MSMENMSETASLAQNLRRLVNMGTNGYYMSEGEFGFKWLDGYRFAILYIPKGTLVHVSGDVYDPVEYRKANLASKRRAECAYVASIGRLDIEEDSIKLDNHPAINYTRYFVSEIRSGLSAAGDALGKHLRYEIGRIVRPSFVFASDADDDCASGIHYFAAPVFRVHRTAAFIATFFSEESAKAIRNWFYDLTTPFMRDQIELEIEKITKYAGRTTGEIVIEEVTQNEQRNDAASAGSSVLSDAVET